MFNRELQVKVVKKPKLASTTDTTEDEFADKATIAAVVAEGVIKKVAMAALSYVLVDTLRQVLVAKAIRQ